MADAPDPDRLLCFRLAVDASSLQHSKRMRGAVALVGTAVLTAPWLHSLGDSARNVPCPPAV